MFELPELEYSYDALGRYISADIMRLHHSKHHQAYVDKLNNALDQAPDLKSKSLESLLGDLGSVPEPIRLSVQNNGGGHFNHTLFWRWMSPDGGGEPTGDLAGAITDKYGSFQSFVDEFTSKSLSIFGSGWCWLQPNLEITTSPNQDSPIMRGEESPILGLDVWEHAYYLDYKNKRDDYVNSWWNVVDWNFVAERFISNK